MRFSLWDEMKKCDEEKEGRKEGDEEKEGRKEGDEEKEGRKEGDEEAVEICGEDTNSDADRPNSEGGREQRGEEVPIEERRGVGADKLCKPTRQFINEAESTDKSTKRNQPPKKRENKPLRHTLIDGIATTFDKLSLSETTIDSPITRIQDDTLLEVFSEFEKIGQRYCTILAEAEEREKIAAAVRGEAREKTGDDSTAIGARGITSDCSRTSRGVDSNVELVCGGLESGLQHHGDQRPHKQADDLPGARTVKVAALSDRPTYIPRHNRIHDYDNMADSNRNVDNS